MSDAPEIGLVGCGRWGRLLLRDLRTLGARVHAVARSEASRARAREGGALSIVDDADRLPERLDGLVVATPTRTHAAVVERLLGRGVPIFVEKPFTSDAAEARRLAALAPDRIFLMDKWRFHPGIEALGEIVRTRELGVPEELRTLRAQWGSAHADVDPIWILAPHDLSIALEVLGAVPTPLAAVAERHRGRPVGISAELAVGAVRVVVEVSARRPAFRRNVQLSCADGTATLDDGWSDCLEIRRGEAVFGDDTCERREAKGELPLLRELRDFLGHLRGGPPPRSSAAEGAAIVEAIARLRALAGLPPQG